MILNPTNKFITQEELSQLRTAQECSGMCLTGGIPMSDPQGMVKRLGIKYDMKDCPIDTEDGQFYEVDDD